MIPDRPLPLASTGAQARPAPGGVDGERPLAHTVSQLQRVGAGGRWKTVKDAAAALGIGRKSLYRLIEEGKIPAYRLGGRRVLVDLGEIEGLLRARPVVPGGPKLGA